MSESDIHFAYHQLVNTHALVEEAVGRGLAQSVMYLATDYQAAVPSRRVARSVSFAIKPPRAQVGPTDFRSRFFEAGAAPHLIQARGTVKRYSKRVRKDGTRRMLGYRRGRTYLAIPAGRGVIFRTRAMHPGMAAGRYLRQTGEKGLPVVQQLLSRSFLETFSP
jgi:hypothetical protein